MPSDTTPLLLSPRLENGNGATGRPLSYSQRFSGFFKAGDDEPSWFKSYKFFFFGSWFNVMLVFVPLSFLSNFLHWDAALRFAFSFVAIMPLAKVRNTLVYALKSVGLYLHVNYSSLGLRPSKFL